MDPDPRPPRRPSRRPRPDVARARHPGRRGPTPALRFRKRCERRHAAKAVVPVERLRPRDLGPTACEQVGAQTRCGRADGAGRKYRLDEVRAPRRSEPGRRPACSRSEPSPPGDTRPSRRAGAPSLALAAGGQKQDEEDRAAAASARCTVLPVLTLRELNPATLARRLLLERVRSTSRSARCSRPTSRRSPNELLRVCRPGGTIGMANFTPEGGVGEFFGVFAPYLPAPPEGALPPVLWGDEEHVRQALRRPRRVARADAHVARRTERGRAARVLRLLPGDLRAGGRGLFGRARPRRGARPRVPRLRDAHEPGRSRTARPSTTTSTCSWWPGSARRRLTPPPRRRLRGPRSRGRRSHPQASSCRPAAGARRRRAGGGA